MTTAYDPYAPPAAPEARPRRWLYLVALIAFTFVAGVAAAGYALSRWDDAARYLGIAPSAPAPVVVPPAPRYALQVPSAATVAAGVEVDRRMADLEGRMAQIDARARAAVGNADRAEGLLVAFAARRALDRGVALGYIESLLRERFGGTQPQAVATIIAAARQPVTLDELRVGLTTATPALMSTGPDDNWWKATQRELRGLVTLRRADTPSSAPNDRVERARSAIEAGQVDAALAEVARLPGREGAAAWIASARRYVAARSALDMIETAALLAPRDERLPEVPIAPDGEPDANAI